MTFWPGDARRLSISTHGIDSAWSGWNLWSWWMQVQNRCLRDFSYVVMLSILTGFVWRIYPYHLELRCWYIICCAKYFSFQPQHYTQFEQNGFKTFNSHRYLKESMSNFVVLSVCAGGLMSFGAWELMVSDDQIWVRHEYLTRAWRLKGSFYMAIYASYHLMVAVR